MSLFQILSVLFALWMIYEVSIHSRKKIISSNEVGLWLAVWGIFIVVAIFPNLLIGIADRLHFARVFDLLTVAGLMILTVMVFFSYFAQRAGNRKLEQLVQDLAIREGKRQIKSKGTRDK